MTILVSTAAILSVPIVPTATALISSTVLAAAAPPGPPSRSEPQRSDPQRSRALDRSEPYRSDPLHRSDPPSLGPRRSNPLARTQSLGPRRPVFHRSDPIAWTPIVHTPIAQAPIARAPTPGAPPNARTHSLGSMAAARTRLCLHVRAADPRLVCVVLCHVYAFRVRRCSVNSGCGCPLMRYQYTA